MNIRAYISVCKSTAGMYFFQELKELKQQFLDIIQSSTKPLTIILDSLDQLRDAAAGLKEWIPRSLPKHVTFIVSTIDEKAYQVGPELRVSLYYIC